MLSHLILFEWKFYVRKISFYIMLLSFLGLGIFVGTSTGISFTNIKYNSPYAINFIFGLFSLASLFPIVIIAAESLNREKDNHFEQILYATPLTVSNYFASRFLLVFGVAVFSFLLFLIGYILGHLLQMDNSGNWGVFHLYYYLSSFFILVLPNIFLCSAIVCCTAWFSNNKMFIYLSGLGIYVLYWVSAIFTNSPLMANASPVSESAMNLSAKLDPFGMAAFFDQTQYWTALRKNTSVLRLSGNLLINRTAIVFLAIAILYTAYRFYQFTVSGKQKKKLETASELTDSKHFYTKIETKPTGKKYHLATAFSFLKIDFKSTIKSASFASIIVITLFVVGMEMYGAIEAGTRVPQNFATTTLMVNTILATIPFIVLLAMLFYGSELVWSSSVANFTPIEYSTPFSNSSLFISKLCTLVILSIILVLFCIALGICFQLLYHFPEINWRVYASLLYFIALPASLCGIVVIAFQFIAKNKYVGLSVSAVFLVLTNSSLGKSLGFKLPILRFANFIPDAFSDMNGFGYLPKTFILKMFYSFSFVLLVAFLAILLKNKTRLRAKWKPYTVLIFPLIAMLLSGAHIYKKSDFVPDKTELNWQQQYENKYNMYKNAPQPTITDVKTTIDLYPEENSYKVQGYYTLVNKTKFPISEILISEPMDIAKVSMNSSQLTCIKKDKNFGQYLFKPKQKYLPNDSILLHFNFEYKINPLKGHQSFNAIVGNGAFMRISNYFPFVGYNPDNEIEEKEERKKRGMAQQDALTKANAPLENPYNYAFINFDAIVSTSKNQTAVSIGALTNSYATNNRNYFHYQAKNVPFRFAVSSARYTVRKANFDSIAIEVLYDPQHYQNIAHLISSIKKTLQYCETNFGSYPYKTIRFAEISSFTRGFAATSYPATIFINEAQFHLNLSKGEGHDVINEIAGHELSHQWWGAAQLSPDYREGSGVLTETLAQYTQLMLFKNEYGNAKMLQMVALYKKMYESEKAFSGEESLYHSNPKNANVIYNKGLVKMYALYQLIGETKINSALKSLLAKHKYPFSPATINDLIDEIKAVSQKKDYKEIERLFKA